MVGEQVPVLVPLAVLGERLITVLVAMLVNRLTQLAVPVRGVVGVEIVLVVLRGREQLVVLVVVVDQEVHVLVPVVEAEGLVR